MNSKLMRTIVLSGVLVLAMVLLCACGGGSGNTAGDDPGFVYLAEYVPLPKDIDSMNNLCYQDGVIYFFSYGVTGTNEPAEGALKEGDAEYYEGMYDVYGAKLCKINLDGSGYEQLTAYESPALPDGKQGDVSVNSICIDAEGNLWICESGYMYHTTDAGEWVDDGSLYFIRKLDKTGAELASVDITALAQGQENFYISEITVDKDGNLCFTDGNTTVYVVDKNGQQLFSVSVQNWLNGLARTGDGQVGAVSYEGSGIAFKLLDMTAKDWGSTIDLPYDVNDVIDGGGEYDFYYRNNSNLYGYKIASKENSKLINWIDSDIDSDNLQNIIVLDDGRIVCSNYNHSMTGESSQELIVLTKTDSAQVQDKQILTLATMWMSSQLRTAVIDFNKTNQQYRIQVKDYSEFNTEEDYNAGMTKLNTEIISGSVPDIIDATQLPLQQYVSKGLLQDLYPYIDNDGELKRDDLMQSIFKAMEINGGLYQLSSNFNITTVVGAPSVVGDKMGWTIDDLMAAWAKMPEGSMPFSYVDRNSMLYYICMFNMNDYVDWSTGKCSFDSDSFIKLLEFANKFPETIDWSSDSTNESEFSKIQSGKVFLANTTLYDFQDYQSYKAMFGGAITYVGFPCESGNGSAAYVESGLAMSSKCADKDGAWQFMRTLLTEEYQKENVWWGYPTNKKVFDEKKAEAMKGETTIDENGNEVAVSTGSMGWDGFEVELYPMTEEDAAQIMAVIESVENTVSYDQSMMEIIQEEAGAYFSGQKTAQEIATIIQSRVNIYVNEQK